METILITGGTGLIGKNLSAFLTKKGYNVTLLSRTKHQNLNCYYWDIDKGVIDEKAIEEADYIIHLAGANIAEGRWTPKRKKEILTSRTESTQLLFEKVKQLNPNLKGFIAASGVGYYGTITSDTIFTENHSPGNDYLSSVCVNWEKESQRFNSIGVRTVILRTGVVFGKKNSALQKISKPINLGFGAVIGNGLQFIPWIHINDLCMLYYFAIQNIAINGIYNAVAPDHINNYELTNLIANRVNKKILLPNIPEFVFKIIFGEMGNLIIKGSSVSPEKILKAGFNFRYSNISIALENLIKK